MAYAVNQVLPSESAESWTRADLQRQQAQKLADYNAQGGTAIDLNAAKQTGDFNALQIEHQKLINNGLAIQQQEQLVLRNADKNTSSRIQQEIGAGATAPQTPVGANTTGAVEQGAPAPGTPAQAPAAPAPNDGRHPIESNLTLPGGAPNFYSDRAIAIGVEEKQRLGIPQAKIDEDVKKILDERNKIIKNDAEVKAAQRKGELDDETAIAKRRQNRAEMADEVYALMPRPGNQGDPAEFAAAFTRGHFTSPEQLKALAEQSDSWKNRQAMRVADEEQKRKNEDTRSLVARRAEESRLEQISRNQKNIDLALQNRQVSVAEAKEATVFAEKAANSVRQGDNAALTRGELGGLRTAIASGKLSAGADGAWVVAAQGLAPGAIANLAKYFTQDKAGNFQITKTQLERLSAQATEIEMGELAASGVKGAGTSDKRFETAHKAIGGGSDFLTNPAAALDNLNFMDKYLHGVEQRNADRADLNNKQAQKFNKDHEPITRAVPPSPDLKSPVPKGWKYEAPKEQAKSLPKGWSVTQE